MKTAPSADRWVLTDQRDFLLRSLEDAAAEHAAGDLDDADFELLQRRDRAKLAEVEAKLAAMEDRPALIEDHRAPTGDRRRSGKKGWRPRRRGWMGVVGALALVAGALVLVFSDTSSRLPGQVATGGVNLGGKRLVEQELDQAAVLDDEGKVVTALAVYNKVLAKHPHQSTALAEGGWLLWESGSGSKNATLEARGRAKVAEAVKVAPKFFAGHLFLGTIDVQQGVDAEAVVQYRLFLADRPPSGWTRDFAPEIRQAFAGAAQPVPAGVPGK